LLLLSSSFVLLAKPSCCQLLATCSLFGLFLKFCLPLSPFLHPFLVFFPFLTVAAFSLHFYLFTRWCSSTLVISLFFVRFTYYLFSRFCLLLGN
jgi:hypothetical protein